MDKIVVGIDVGTSKVCTLVGRLEPGNIRIMGVGIEPSAGIRKGQVDEIVAAAQAIARSVEMAERTSGYQVKSASANLSSSQVSLKQQHTAVGVQQGIITEEDTARLMESVQEMDIPTDRELLHIIPLGFQVDGGENIYHPVGMQGGKLEMEVNLLTVPAGPAQNLRATLSRAGVEPSQLVLSPLASAKAVLTTAEREMGVLLCDLGGGTTDLAFFTKDVLQHAAALPVHGDHITADIGYFLQIPFEDAEQVKRKFGYALRDEVKPEQTCEFVPAGKKKVLKFNRQELADVIQARGEEIFNFILNEIQQAGFTRRLSAGVVLTGGSSLLPGIKDLARGILGVPVRTAGPGNLVGLTDKIQSPAFSTGVGLMRWAADRIEAESYSITHSRTRALRGSRFPHFTGLKEFLARLAGDSTTDAPPPGSKKIKGV